MDNDFYVYEWYNLDTNEVFYVGKGKKERYKNIKQRNQYFKNYYNKHKCTVRKIKTDLLENEAFELEINLIDKYRKIGQCQCNLADGGEGTTFPKGSWNDMFRKLQYLHDVKGAMNGMYNEEKYDPKNLKNLSLNELNNLYKEYERYKEGIKLELYDPQSKNKNKLTGFELKTENEELIMITELIANSIAKDNKEFNNFLNWKSEEDFICIDFDSDKFLEIMFSDINYFKILITVLLNVLWFMKQMNDNPKISVPVNIKSYRIENNYLHIRFDTSDDKTKRRIKINLYDIVWGILMFKNKALYQIIYDEILFAPFI